MGKGCEVEFVDMITTAQIRAMIQQLELSKISLDEFEDWFTASSWNAHQLEGPDGAEVLQMIGKVELCLAEGEAIPYGKLLKELGQIAGVFQIVQPSSLAQPISGGNVNFVSPRKEQLAGADKRPLVGFSYTPLQPA